MIAYLLNFIHSNPRTAPCCMLEQDTLVPESTSNTQEAVAPSRHDRKSVDWDVIP